MIFLLLFSCLIGSTVCIQMCPREDLEQCLKLADPFIQQDKFVFPISRNEIDEMCRAWDTLTACVRNFVLRCLSSDRQHEFDLAVQESEDTMKQMCLDPGYQAAYLQNANCIKSVSVKRQRCGDRYNKLVGEVATRLDYDSLCCHFGKFRNCVLSFTAVDCSPAASDFAKHLLDKSMGVLLRKCRNATQTELLDDCPSTAPPPNSERENPNSVGSGMNQVGNNNINNVPQQQPTVLVPTPRPTARWTFDPQNIGGLEPESWQDYGSKASCLCGHQLLLVVTFIFGCKFFYFY